MCVKVRKAHLTSMTDPKLAIFFENTILVNACLCSCVHALLIVRTTCTMNSDHYVCHLITHTMSSIMWLGFFLMHMCTRIKHMIMTFSVFIIDLFQSYLHRCSMQRTTPWGVIMPSCRRYFGAYANTKRTTFNLLKYYLPTLKI